MKPSGIQRVRMLLARVARRSMAARAPLLAALALIITPPAVFAQSGANPVPFIAALQPVAVAPGSGDFTLTVLGANLVSGQSAIYWNGAALPDLTTCTRSKPGWLAKLRIGVGRVCTNIQG